MGDRANVFIQQELNDGEWQGIGIYSHWDGVALHRAAIEAMAHASDRIGDPSYYARIIVHNVLIKLADPSRPTGFGLWVVAYDDNEHPILVINAWSGKHWLTTLDTYRQDQPDE